LDNLRAAVVAREVAPQVPVVLRAFDPALADQLEQGLNIRRAYSVSALAAPAFVAAACGDQVLETLRLGDGEVPVCRLTVRPGSPLAGRTTGEVKARHGCATLARSRDGADWRPVCGAGDAEPLAEGEHILVGGPLTHVLRLICLNVGWLREGKRRPRTSKTAGGPERNVRPMRPRHATLLPYIAAALASLLILSVGVFAWALHLRWVDAVYFVVTTATTTGYGDISLKDGPDWIKLFGCLVMLSGGALLGILFSYLAALATAERLDAVMGRRAARMSGHVVLAGLGNLGYRVARLLTDLGLDVVVLELAVNARFVEAVRARAPVFTGDARLPENQERAAVRRAAAFLSCTDDDLANIQACLHARRLNPRLTTVARIFDDALAERLTDAFAINRALSASQCAVGAFVGAATDERALRPLRVGALDLIACRYTAQAPIPAAAVAGWRAAGVRVLAWRAPSGAVQPPSGLAPPLTPGDEIILCGPADTMREIMAPA
ncbi:MAG: potassium channel family protein, partial [Armatimonadetes bacterium]|nr:potassium channel family protein [Armatimonadota bacterium]